MQDSRPKDRAPDTSKPRQVIAGQGSGAAKGTSHLRDVLGAVLVLVLMTLLSPPAGAIAPAPGSTIDPGLTPAAWSPYLAGALIGVLVALAMLISGHPIGASSAYARVIGLAASAVAPRHIRKLKYYKENPPKWNWFVMLVTFVIVGSFMAAWTGGEVRARWLPPMWTDRFGEDSLGWRLLAAFAGGLFMALGARIAGGCTSGHGISGTLQLSVGSWISVLCFFIGGVVMAFLLYRI